MFTATMAAAAIAAATITAGTAGQTPAGQSSSSSSGQSAQPVAQITVPGVTVTAQKEPADAQRLPLAVTPLTWEMLQSSGVTMIRDAARYSPNTYIQELSARKISNPRMRGIGSSPANPGITTFIDGVPQLNTNTSNVDFLDVEQVEFVRGPQSGLYGRNTLGGLININSVRPSLYDWHGSVGVPLGNYDARAIRANLSGPMTPRLGVSVAIGHAQRDGFSTNTITGNDIDSRSATSFKGQLLWTPSSIWEARLIARAERARDGDYALSDLGSLRANEYDTARDYEGETERDIMAATFIARRATSRFTFTSITGLVNWSTLDDTDLDYTPLPLITRVNDESGLQLTQEVRLASGVSPIALTDRIGLRWQTGAMMFVQGYDQEAVNTFAPFVLSEFVPMTVRNTSPLAELSDLGVGLYAQGTFTFSTVDLTLGARYDREVKDADIRTTFDPAIFPTAPPLVTDETYSNVSPQAALSWHVRPQTMLYVSGGGGYKSGGFNPSSVPGSEAYGEEKSWNTEAGVKTTWADGRVTANAAVFIIDWNDMQLNVPIPQGGGAFFISNVGSATSKGVELELGLRPMSGVDLFGSFGITRATFGDGSHSMGLAIDGNDVPGTPEYTAAAGAQITRQIIRSWNWFARGEGVFYGGFQFDESNAAGQEAYSLVNLRGGVTGRRYSVIAWMNNAFDTFYVPVAFAYPGLAPSGFVGEPGRPRTFGIDLGVRF